MTEVALRTNFLQKIIEDDLASGKHQTIVTRFPPEPNGFLHVGHAKSICVNFGLAKQFGGVCHLRFDDTNPEKEESLYVNAIKKDLEWLGFSWQGNEYHASDYFEKLYQAAVVLIEKGLAYVCSLNGDQIREYRGTLQEPGKPSPDRDRAVEENLALFEKMRQGEFQDGEYVLRAKIDMASPNINMRDPIIYRVRHITHQNTGDTWCIYPMYDFAHCLSDAIEAITHSICTLEFQDHRPLYDWFVEHCEMSAVPRQYEFSRLNVSHCITSKRKLKQLVDEQRVSGWDDPRMPTLSGMRRRGFPAKALVKFCEDSGISKSDSVLDMSLLEECVRDELNQTAPRAMVVLNPIKVVIENYEADDLAILASNHPQDESQGKRELMFSKELYIEAEDFMEEPPKKFHRLAPGKEVRLRNAYVIKCEEVIKDDNGHVVELRCTYDPDTLGKKPEGRKVKGVIHWVSSRHALDCEVRLYDRLFKIENPGKEENFLDCINEESLTVIEGAKAEPSLADAHHEKSFQFERLGYFTVDNQENDKLVFNRVIQLRDNWANNS